MSNRKWVESVRDLPTLSSFTSGGDMNTDVMFSSADAEWYTPPDIATRARDALGGEIDLDPCSTPIANRIIKARRIFTEEDNGLQQLWQAETLFLNPPYRRGIHEWLDHLNYYMLAGQVKRAIALIPNRTDTIWIQILRNYPRCHITGRLSFWRPDDLTTYTATFPSAVVALNCDPGKFYKAFSPIGNIFVRYDPHDPRFAAYHEAEQ